jgi:hypothetical protein
MADAAAAPLGTRSNRFWLFAPIALLILVAIAWTVAWFVIRDRTAERLEAVQAAEARAGRQWTCKDRSISGYPFRIEVACAELSVLRDGIAVSLGRVESVAQVYQPRFVITEIDGPMTASDGRVTVQGSWRLLEASVRAEREGLQRISLVADAPRFTIAGAAPESVVISADRFEAHLRPNLSRPQDQAFDVAVRFQGASLPALDEVFGEAAPTNLETDLTVTRAAGFAGRPLPVEIERWRAAGGKLDILEFLLTKGGKRIDVKGTLGLDDLHRPTGELVVATAGLDTLIASLAGNGLGGSLLGGLFGGGQATGGAPAALKQLPPLRLDNGRILVGPFTVPRLRLAPLY